MKYQLRPESGRDYAAELNPEQYAAVMTEARHALVIAGAGSGKTRTLTYRVARLIDSGVAPWRILLLTFTNKAAREMLERVGQLVDGAGQVWGGTFHSVANRLLRRYASRLGYRENFSILDSDDQKVLYRALVKQYAGKTDKNARFPKPEMLLSLHSLAANTARTWEATLAQEHPELLRHKDVISRIYEAYAQRKMDGNAMDFDDLLLNLVRLLKEHADVREDLQQRFAHVLVDEYQDTNAPQEEIISMLAGGPETSLMVVGDDAQSIYSWRGANVEHIFDFEKAYPDAVTYKIETNYRSVPSILAVSNAAIRWNTRQIAKELRSAREPGQSRPKLPVVLAAPDNRTEARFVAQRIDELMADGRIQGKDIAVLYRAHFQSLDVQMALTKSHIPYRVTSGLRFFEQAHVKDVVAYLRLLANHRDEMAFKRIVSTFPRVGEATAAKLWDVWRERVGAWFDAHPDATRLVPAYPSLFNKVAVPAAARLPWAEFLANMDKLNPRDVVLTTAELVKKATSFMEAYMRSAYDNFDERLEDLDQLALTLAEQPDLDAFLAQVALMSEVDKETALDDDCVTLSTIHQAKGLEWKVVFVVFLAEGLFPHGRALASGDPKEVEEETRLFYVAVTRAQDQLYLSYPRYNGNGYDSQYCSPSRFLRSLPKDLIEQWEV